MKISSIQCYTVDPGFRSRTWIFVKVSTDAGIHGWGEAYTLRGRDRAIVAQIDELGTACLGRSPFNIKHFTQIVQDDFAQRRSSFELYCAQSAIEQAMWDIVGKACGQPVYNLLGGKCREKIRVYANGWSDHCKTPEEYGEAAAAVVEKGFTAIKLSPLPGTWRTYVPREHEHHVVSVIRAVRDAVGPKVDILLDMLRRLNAGSASRLGRQLEPFDLYWYEEPCWAENVDALAEVRSKVGIPVVTGETLYGKAAFQPVLERRAADILNPDICNVGGILELKEIAAMAEPHYVAISPHNFNSTTIALNATVHAAAVMPNFTLTEYYLPFADFATKICPAQLIPENGFIALPDAPGLGLDLDESLLRQYAGFAGIAPALASPEIER
ncbi:mandelate racemase/muconate lactonizing enzyme family protein [Paraburkholderia sp. Cy-641]|uniref:mandelate racemase/muconate lactonizing enzyme family protein n=1 Tax=Paraburkholderia sp. Cy-641 TaxID=2608337 RepID=UPI0014235509|nr:mandelate racemase/muconate lactonizing enzyme family protein [Paraburkholderia sp. Cy-641]NIF76829.1 mandelate racemase/muconate lactonizing enzyme family protein [Paraburkholderia sp. Cy-641]